MTDAGIFVGGGGEGYGTPQELLLKYGNRHGLVAGATGTGKTVTLQILAEGFSAAGVPVFLADVKSDLAGLAVAGSPEAKLHDAFMKRCATIGYDLNYRAFPVAFWDLFGEQGHPIRTTVTEMGPLLLSRLMDLSDAQEGVLNIAFRLADEEGLPLLDLKDLQAMLVWIGQNAAEIGLRYGNVAAATVGAIQRQLLVLENQGGTRLFGEPALDLADMMRLAPDGRGQVNILAADKLMASPRLYATFLLWLLSELFEELPEVGDPDKPKFVFFFDEAHLLFDDAPKALVDKVEQVARLIRSKGVGVFFITQNPADVPDDILGQLGNRVQHALRAFTAKDQKDLARAAQNYRPNPAFDTETAIKEVGTGEAVTSFLQNKGVPGIVERTLVRPPASQLGPITPEERRAVIAATGLGYKYDQTIDRDSAFERLQARAEAAAQAAAEAEAAEEWLAADERARKESRRYEGRSRRGSSRSDSIATAFGKSLARQLGTKTGQAIVRGILGSLFKSR
ncbi:helicase HerA-like domain-containing protein [Defluviimonas sp. D31]|uniref:helicase HerA-like domain-containing protein n=1 Tax=Defluviimonas sp. D31 TaxID=3083253 RepID=UPI00296E478F|nr:helicase HerA-like domain-containing protein [Defluviimonas sp. D31]MDW4548627.1 helicase HerA-like domain-containing protein [Defluviimonas sp. D31]